MTQRTTTMITRMAITLSTEPTRISPRLWSGESAAPSRFSDHVCVQTNCPKANVRNV